MADDDQQLEALAEMFPPGVELDPELAAYRYEYGEWPVVKHPLVFDVPYMGERMNKALNERLVQKKEMLASAASAGKWHHFVFLHERPYRLWAFHHIEEGLADEEYWQILGSIWTDSENIHEEESDWIEALGSDRAERERMMDEDERAALKLLPLTLDIHRGFSVDDRERGLSWTTSFQQAEWFAKRLVSQPYERPRVASATVRKERVLAYFLGRGESEVVVLPDDLKLASIKEVG